MRSEDRKLLSKLNEASLRTVREITLTAGVWSL
jgi:hypothetical protein